MEPIRTLIVDDEPAAREGIHHLLERDPEIVVVGECSNGPAAVRAIDQTHPHLVFLDVQMPGMDGFAVLRKTPSTQLPAVVFVTAFDKHALRAFEVHAVDYLLKPYDDRRFYRALGRAKQQIKQGRLSDLGERLAALVNEGEGASRDAERRYLKRLPIRLGERVTLIDVNEIDWIGAHGDYLRVYTGSTWHLLRENLQTIETELDPNQFVRIHRSTIVNLDSVHELEPYDRGAFLVKLKDGTRLKLSRSRREALEDALGRRL